MRTIIKRLLKENMNTIRNMKQTAPTYKKLEYILFLDEKKEMTDVSKLFTHIIMHLFGENRNIFFSN